MKVYCMVLVKETMFTVLKFFGITQIESNPPPIVYKVSTIPLKHCSNILRLNIKSYIDVVCQVFQYGMSYLHGIPIIFSLL